MIISWLEYEKDPRKWARLARSGNEVTICSEQDGFPTMLIERCGAGTLSTTLRPWPKL